MGEMEVELHDVDHGGCVTIISPTGERLLLDCGTSRHRPWRPSIAHWGQTIHTLMLLNLDEDHAADLDDVLSSARVRAFVSNPTITAPALEAMKAGGMGRGVAAAHRVLQDYGSGLVGDWTHPLGGVKWQAFWNRYWFDFTDTNNLSLAVFVTWGNFTILFGGDMECAGWQSVLRNPAFVARLPEVKVYVASHHGRDNGCCDALFAHMNPHVIMFSDGPKIHATQDTTSWYGRRAQGLVDYSRPGFALGPYTHRVMTTRKLGTMKIVAQQNGRFNVYYERQAPPDLSALAALFAPMPSGLVSAYP